MKGMFNLMKIFKIVFILIASMLFVACSARVDLADPKLDREAKKFAEPDANFSGIYIYRDSLMGKPSKKAIYIDGEYLGKTADRTYFYKIVKPGYHTIETESEFSNNSLEIYAEGGSNYFIRQYIKMGVFVPGAGLQEVNELLAKKSIIKSKLIKTE